MNKIISIVFTFIVLFSTCRKNTQHDELQDLEETNFTNTENVRFKMNNDCKSYEDFEHAFCHRTLLPDNQESALVLPPSDSSDPEFYEGKSIELLVGGKSIHVTPLLNTENETDFYIETDKETFILTKSEDVVLNSKAIADEVPDYLNSLYLIIDSYLSDDFAIGSLQGLIGNAGNVAMNGEQLTLTIENATLLPKNGVENLKIIFSCDWEKAITINKYLSKIGWPNDDLTLYPYYVETALEDCDWECRYCTEPLCVFDGIRTIGTFTYEELEQLDNALLKYSLTLNHDEISRLQETQNIEIKENLVSLMSGDDYCRKYDVGDEVVDLLEEGVFTDICGFNTSPQEMILAIMNHVEFETYGVVDFYNSLEDNFDFIIMDDSFSSNERAKCIWSQVINNNNEAMCSTLSNFWGGLNMDIYLYIQDFGVSTALGFTDLLDGGAVSISLDKTFVNEGCIVEIVEVILHEGIHAEILRRHSEYTLSELYAIYPVMMEYFDMENIDYHHEYMANEWIEILLSSLQEFYNDDYNDTEYQTIIWRGLHSTNAFANSGLTIGDINSMITLIRQNCDTSCD